MTYPEQKKAAKKFAEYWQGKGYEKGESQPFWLALLRDVFGVAEPEKWIKFEAPVLLGHTGFIDGYIEATRVLIEQKGLDKDLRAKIKQSDGSFLTPFEQAKRYITELPLSKQPRWVVTCNFASFLVYDREHPSAEPEEILLKDLAKDFYRLSFLVDVANEHLKREMDLSMQAGRLVGYLYDEILKCYIDKTAESTLKSLNKLCVRLVFCLYAEDAGIFPIKNQFHDYLAKFEPDQLRMALIDLFHVLDTKPESRDKYLTKDLADFPYVNGGLFADEDIEIPLMDDKVKNLLLEKASDDFDWSDISPTIFGAVFESTLNPETRRSGGMHYTSIENIHKVIDPLFLDGLRDTLRAAVQLKDRKERLRRLREFQENLSSLTFLDPACGSGNFLTETFLSLRRLENEVIMAIHGEDTAFLGEALSPVLMSINQFYGIEINDFAVSVAKTALWIAESQMLRETEEIVGHEIDFLPLKTNAFIQEGNALRLDWNSVVPKEKLNYIMGNPPFVGYTYQTPEQREDMLRIYVDESGKPYKMAGKIDYVAGWYFKAALLMQNTSICTAFVSTNSITQGEQVESVWKPLYERFGIHIDFAHRTFRWDSEASIKAHVHCVIIGFSSRQSESDKIIFDEKENRHIASVISPYLIDAPAVFLESRNKPICNAPSMTTGNRPADGGHLIIEEKDYDDFISKDPNAVKYIKKLIGSEEFINNKKRYCLWLVGVSPAELRKMPQVINRVELCRQDRLNSPDEGRRKLAEKPALFRETINPDSFIIVPSVSSERRKYIPMGFMGKETISTNLNIIIPDATLYHFGILTSSVHMAWTRVVCGRLKSDYRYSIKIVYNNFPWPEATEEQKKQIEVTAQGILDARDKYPDCSLADLYDEATMPPELRKAHQANDAAVMKLYGYKPGTPEPAIVADLMKRYQQMISKTTKS